MQKKLKQIYLEHNGKISDKWSLYLEEWDRLFKHYQNKQIKLLEIGIQNGGSLEIWSKYFLKAKKIVGCDINTKCRELHYNDDRIAVVIGDANLDATESDILQQSTTFDIIIDDGSHTSSDIVLSFARYFPHLSDDGIYVIEDLHASYWKDYQGGIYEPLSAIAFLKRLVDIVNYEHWRNNKSRWSLLKAFSNNLGLKFKEIELTKVHSIEFINSMCIIKKMPSSQNTLGKRVVVGEEEKVSSGWKTLNSNVIQDYAMDIQDSTNLDIFELIEKINSLNTTFANKEQMVKALTIQVNEIENVRDQQVNELRMQVAEIENTRILQVDEQKHIIQSLREQMQKDNKEKERVVTNLLTQISEKDANFQSLSVHLSERENILQALNAKLLEIYSSSIWRSIQFVARVRLALIPHNSRIARILRRLHKLLLTPQRVPAFEQNIIQDISLINASGSFDRNWYLTNYSDIAKAKIDPVRHYLLFGGFEGRDPNPNFSSSWYLDAYEDVRKSGMNPLVHYLKYGMKEKRDLSEASALIRTSDMIDEGWYLEHYSDIAEAKIDPVLHYLLFGGFEGRDPSPHFCSTWYLEAYEDVRKSGMNPLVHYLKYGKQQGRTLQTVQTKEDLDLIRSFGLFSEHWYLNNNPDVAEAKVDPLVHYLQLGGFEGRDPSESFSSKWYLETYPDVQALGVNPLLHFVKYGIAEKRVGHPHFWARKWGRKIDSAAQIPLQVLLDRLKIPLKSSEVLSTLKTSLLSDKYSKTLEDLFTVEQFISSPQANQIIYPIVQASKLPEIVDQVRRRRILFVTSQFPNPYHGGGARVVNFIKILSQNNEIYLSTFFDPNSDTSALKELEPYCKSIQTIPYWKFGRNQAEIRNWLKDVKIDVVHYEWPQSLLNYDPSFSPIQIFTYMEAVSLRLQMEINHTEPLSRLWLEKFLDLIYALHLELADAAQLTARIAVTTKDGEYFKELYPYQEYSVLNHGVIFDEFSLPDVEPEPNTLVFVGNYLHYPNVDAMEFFLNEMWPSIQKQVPGVRIYIVGPNPPETISRFADGEHIIVTGGVSDHRLYIQKATLGIAPLISGAGMRGKVIDYAGLRRTFVATSIAMTDLAFENGVDFYCADTAQEFTQKIIDLLKDDDMRTKMSASALNSVRQNYDTYKLTNFLIRLYQQLEAQVSQAESKIQLESPISSLIDVKEWLSFYEQRVELSLPPIKDNDLSRWPKVTILVLTYNNLLINQLCLRSIYCNTTYPNFEVIVVDNASSDETPVWLSTYAKTHSNMKLVLNTDNRGFAGGNNQAARMATGEYLIFLNNDTVVTNGWVERLLTYMQDNPEIGLVGPVTNSTGNEARISIKYRSPIEMEAISEWRARYLAGQAFDIRMLAFYCVMARKNEYEALGGLDERYLVGMFEDDDLSVQYHLKGQRVVCAEDVFIHHFHRASFGKLENAHQSQLFEENKQKYEEKWQRKWEPYQSR